MTAASERQLTFSLPHRTALGRDDFMVAGNNETAVHWVDRWPDWPGGILVIAGPAASGKSHLLEVWRAKSAAMRLAAEELTDTSWQDVTTPLAVDGLEGPFNERALLHVINWVRERGLTLLIASQTPPSVWTVKLPDLRSRLATLQVVEISEPDDALLDALIVKQFNDRQLSVTPDVVNFLRLRIERSFDAVRRTVDRLDRAALAEKRAITLPFARRILSD